MTATTAQATPGEPTAEADRAEQNARAARRIRRGARLIALAAAGSLTLGAAAYESTHDDPDPTTASSSASSASSAELSPGTAAGPADENATDVSATAPGPHPFTGRLTHRGRVLAVKFDNARGARPHHGLDQADLVYVEKVEGGMSRLMGVYSSSRPRSLGPVRSARESDVELLKQFGRPVLAYSGVRSSLAKFLRRSPIHIRPHGKVPRAYFRANDRQAPHNLFVKPWSVLRTAPAAPKTSLAKDIGFRFGPAPRGGKRTWMRSVNYSAARHSFRWSPKWKKWMVSFDGVPARLTSGKQMSARTIVIQKVLMRPSKYRDVNGAVTPYIHTVGRGTATVLRDGKAYDTVWKRPSAAGGTTFSLKNGTPMNFARGQVWIVFADR